MSVSAPDPAHFYRITISVIPTVEYKATTPLILNTIVLKKVDFDTDLVNIADSLALAGKKIAEKLEAEGWKRTTE